MKKIVTKVDDMFKAWQKADDAARVEGVKRLGLPENNTALDRAKAMGFGDDVYHGTKADITDFSNAKTGDIEAAKQAAFREAQELGMLDEGMTPDDALEMMDGMSNYNKMHFVTPEPEISDFFAGLENKVDALAPKVMPLKTRGNIFDFENPEHIAQLEKKIGKQIFGVDTGKWQHLEAGPVQEGIRSLGFDGFNATEDLKNSWNGVKNTGLYNGSDIRSKFAHFNPKMAGIGAGSILSTNLMADELDLEHKPKTSIWDSLMNTIGNVNQQQAQAYGNTAVSTASTIGDIVSDPSVAAELGIKGLRGTATGLLLNSGSVEAAEDPNFLNKLQRQR